MRRPAGSSHIYAIALGSNQPRSRLLTPQRLVEQAIDAFSRPPFRLIARSPILETPPIGPSLRRYANAALLVETSVHGPDAMLRLVKAMERAAGRRTRQRWGARPLDLDLILWSGGAWASPGLVIPHTAFRQRDFVLVPLNHIAADWRDPISGLSIAHLLARFKKPRKLCKGG